MGKSKNNSKTRKIFMEVKLKLIGYYLYYGLNGWKGEKGKKGLSKVGLGVICHFCQNRIYLISKISCSK